MGQALDGSATTTEAIRRAIQHSQESLRSLAKRYGINQKTVAKWKKRTSVADLPTGPSAPKSTVLSGDDEAIIVAFRHHTLLPLDDGDGRNGSPLMRFRDQMKGRRRRSEAAAACERRWLDREQRDRYITLVNHPICKTSRRSCKRFSKRIARTTSYLGNSVTVAQQTLTLFV
jgi:hypothetical protein